MDTEQVDCAVCLEELVHNLATLPCGHVFHKPCATSAVRSKPMCPYCRKPATANQLTPLFFDSPRKPRRASAPTEQAVNDAASSSRSLEKENATLRQALLLEKRKIKNMNDRMAILEGDATRERLNTRSMETQLQATRKEMRDLEQQLKLWKRRSGNTEKCYNEMVREKSVLERKVRVGVERLLLEVPNNENSPIKARQIIEDFSKEIASPLFYGRKKRFSPPNSQAAAAAAAAPSTSTSPASDQQTQQQQQQQPSESELADQEEETVASPPASATASNAPSQQQQEDEEASESV